jgi:hypothetical protein
VVNFGLGVLLTREVTRNPGPELAAAVGGPAPALAAGGGCFLVLWLYLQGTDKDA